MKALRLTLILIGVLIFIGCAYTERDSLISKGIAKQEGKYRIWFFLNETDFGSGVFPKEMKEATEFETIGKIEGMNFYRMNDEDTADYRKFFKINVSPTILVFDNQGLVFQTTELNELREFLFAN